MRKLLIALVFLGVLSPALADSYKEQLRQYKLIYIALLEKKIEKIPKGTTIEVFLKDGTSERGILLKYNPYNDVLWIRPLNARWGFLSDDAYDIQRIMDVSVIVLRSI